MDFQQQEQIVNQIKSYVLDNFPLASMNDEQLEEKIEEVVANELNGVYVSLAQRAEIVKSVFSAIRGFGLLDGIMSDESITEVMINGADNIFIEKNGKLQRLDNKFENQRKLEDIIQRIVGLAGREVNQSSPIVDTRLPDGSRVNVVLPPIALCGPKDERVITIEDSAELQIVGVDNLVSLETRNANAAGTGLITIRDLIKSSLRMRPERIVVGEVRGGEALDMLQAMNTGHDGSLSTGHANSTKDMLSRLETMVLQGADGLPLEAIRQQIASAVDIMIHLSRLRDHSRKTMEITEIVGYENGQIILNPLYVFEEDENTTLEKVSGSLKRTKNPLRNDFKLKLMGYHGEI